ncbi:CHAT domain-containing protein [Streptomyces brasiliscabiei]|uniref:CHAT domain-containing protein n=1 Tax=Streptomyces brasiliscabiei TaxID=2736302 RepID=A0ABU8G596_9ACTN
MTDGDDTTAEPTEVDGSAPHDADDPTAPVAPRSAPETLAPADPMAEQLAVLGIPERLGLAELRRLRVPLLFERPAAEAMQRVTGLAREAAAASDHDLSGRAHFMLGMYHFLNDDYTAAEEHLAPAHVAYERAGDRVGLARVAQFRSNILRLTSDPRRLDALSETLALARHAQDPLTEAGTWLDLALHARDRGDSTHCEIRSETAFGLLRPAFQTAAHAVRNQGWCRAERHDMDGVREAYEKALQLYRLSGAPASETATTLVWWGEAERKHGNPQAARELLTRAVEAATSDGGDLVAEAEARAELAEADHAAGDLRSALSGYQAALSAIGRTDSSFGQNHLTHANVAYGMGRLTLTLIGGGNHARTYVKSAYKHYRKAGEPRGMHNSARNRADGAMDDGRLSVARKWLSRALPPLADDRVDPTNRLRLLTSLGRLVALENRPGATRRAPRLLTRALRGYEEIGSLRNQGLVLLTALRAGTGVAGLSAEEAGEEAVRRYHRADDQLGAAEAQLALAVFLSGMSDAPGGAARALEHGRQALSAIEEIRATSPDAVTGASFFHQGRPEALSLLPLAVHTDPAFAARWLETSRNWAITEALRTGVAHLSPEYGRWHAELRRHERTRPTGDAPEAERIAWKAQRTALHRQMYLAFTRSLPPAARHTEPLVDDAPVQVGARTYALYVETFGGQHVMAVCRHPDGSLEASRSTLPAEVMELLDDFRAASTDLPRSPWSEAAWRRLATCLLPEKLSAVLAATPEDDPVRLVVLPANELWGVPYAALPLPGTGEGHGEGVQLVDRAVITLAPSLRSLRSPRREPGEPGEQAGGEPRSGSGTEGGRRVVGLVPRGAASAPYAEAELARLKERVPRAVTVEEVTTYDELSSALATTGAELLYAAAHNEGGHHPGQDIRTDSGALNDWSVLDLRVPPTVLLGSCGSGRIWHQQGSEPSGLALSLRLAGAHDVVAPTKDVHGSACAALLPELAARVLAGRPPARALRDLQRRARDADTDIAPRLRQQWLWFRCIGSDA